MFELFFTKINMVLKHIHFIFPTEPAFLYLRLSVLTIDFNINGMLPVLFAKKLPSLVVWNISTHDNFGYSFAICSNLGKSICIELSELHSNPATKKSF